MNWVHPQWGRKREGAGALGEFPEQLQSPWTAYFWTFYSPKTHLFWWGCCNSVSLHAAEVVVIDTMDAVNTSEKSGCEKGEGDRATTEMCTEPPGKHRLCGPIHSQAWICTRRRNDRHPPRPKSQGRPRLDPLGWVESRESQCLYRTTHTERPCPSGPVSFRCPRAPREAFGPLMSMKNCPFHEALRIPSWGSGPLQLWICGPCTLGLHAFQGSLSLCTLRSWWGIVGPSMLVWEGLCPTWSRARNGFPIYSALAPSWRTPSICPMQE